MSIVIASMPSPLVLVSFSISHQYLQVLDVLSKQKANTNYITTLYLHMTSY